MEYLVTTQEMQNLDRATIDQVGIGALVLMERAAMAACEEILCRYKGKKKNQRVLILAGCGNNGADGLALARMLSEEGFEVQVVICGNRNKATDQWKTQYKILKHFPVETGCKTILSEYDILVDALFGVGLSREISGEYADIVHAFNGAVGFKVALDIPSGVHADNGRIMGCATRVDLTVCFAFPKRGLLFYPGCEYAGELVVRNIGIGEAAMESKPQMFRYTESVKELMPLRDEAGNKGTFGKALIAAGSRNMAGAAVLAAKACYRVGTGMVKVLTEECNREILQTAIPESLFVPTVNAGDVQANLPLYDENVMLFDWPDVLAIGPGLGTDEQAYVLVSTFLKKSVLPLVMDADALNLLAAHKELMEEVMKQGAAGRCLILTPHVGELSRLTGKSIKEIKEDPVKIAMELAKRLRCIIVSKDARTLVCCEGEGICMNTTGNSGMSTAGSGDVLTGIITGLLALGMSGFEAASTGVYLHGLAGDYAAKRLGKNGLLAGDIALAIADVLR